MNTRSSSGLTVSGPVGSYQKLSLGGLQDGYVMKFNTSLERVWSTYVGGSQKDVLSAGIVDGNFYVTGGTLSTDYPILGSIQTWQGPATQGDGVATEFSLSGALVWSSFIGGDGTEDVAGVTTWFGKKYFTGITTSVNNFPLKDRGNGAFFEQNYKSSIFWPWDSFIMEIDVCGQQGKKGIIDDEKQHVEVFPNPTTGQLNIHLPSSELEEVIRINGYDMMGNLVLSENVSYSQGSNYSLDLSNLNRGFYIFSISSKTINEHFKIFLIE